MKRLLTILCVLPMAVMAQFSDAFTDGDFTNNPTWQGEAVNFEINVSNELHLNAPAVTDKTHLTTSSVAIDTASWQCYVRLEFNPSSSNKARVYLVSDQADLEGGLNGYFIQIGNTEDEVSLYRQTGTSTTKIIDGPDGLVNESIVEVLVKATRDTDGHWELFADTSLTSSFVSQGTVQDTTYQSSQYFGVYCDYTSTRSDKFYFDDFVITGNAYLDLIAPTISSVVASSSTELVISFSEALDQTSAELISNYSVSNGIGSPTLASLIAPDSVVLSFGQSFPSGTTLTLTTNQVEDLSGNQILSASNDFVFYEFSLAAFRDIIINEFMADPTPSFGLPELEFVEIYNPTNQFFDLSNLSLSDASSTGHVQAFEVLAPGEYAILCGQANVAFFQSFGRTIALSSLPALNNDGDDIVISIDSTIIDRISYTSSWYNDSEKASGGYSLELINPENPCSGKNNWTASNSAIGGTPGQQNSVFNNDPDTEAPLVIELNIVSINEIELVFNEVMDSASLISGTYALSNGLNLQSIQVSPFLDKVNLTLSASIDSSLMYSLVLSGQKDCAGNIISSEATSFGIGVAPQPYDLIINEVYPILSETSGLPYAEFIELYNRSEKLISTVGLKISDASTSSSLFSSTLLPGEYIIVCDDSYEALFSSFGKVVPCSSMPSLNNTGDAIKISFEDKVIDEVNYSDEWFIDSKKSTGGWSLERINPSELCGTDNNWQESTNDVGGTPGTLNSILLLEDAAKPSLISAQFISLSEVDLSFNTRLDTNQSAKVYINSVDFDMIIGSSQNRSNVLSAENFERGTLYTVELDSIKNCVGEKSFNLSYEVYLHDSGDIVLNEVLFNPRGSGSDFVELYNASQYDINLSSWSLAYYDSKDSLKFNLISSAPYRIDPSGYSALCEDQDDVALNYPFTVIENLWYMNLPTYSNTEGSVILYDQLGDQMDRFDYHEDFHFALLSDLDGVSLERLSPSRASNDAGNWHSASSNENYATPGYRNSQDYQNSNTLAGVTLGSQYISPDNDGYQDVVAINYQFPEAGYSMTIRVFNDRGVEVKTVTSNQLIGSEGAFTWDGTNDLGEKVATGIHIVLAEAFNLKNEKEQFRLPLVVATKLN